MSDIEWSPWIKCDGVATEPECPDHRLVIHYDAPPPNATHYRIPMEDYRRITGMPSWDDAPEWALALGQDSDGGWVWLPHHEPSDRDDEEWVMDLAPDPQYKKIDGGTVLGDWRDTLQERPADPLATHPDSELDADQYSVGADTPEEMQALTESDYHDDEPAYEQDDGPLSDEMIGRIRDTAGSPTMTAPDFLSAALSHMQDRASTYDSPQGERSMGKTVAAFNAITGHELTEEQGWLFMVLLKSVRTQQGGFRADNYEDGAAYFGLQGEAAHHERG